MVAYRVGIGVFRFRCTGVRFAKYSYDEYPANPNGSDYSVAGICSADGSHLAMMPHLERAIFPWQNAWYLADRKTDEITPWMEAFVNARVWIENQKK